MYRYLVWLSGGLLLLSVAAPLAYAGLGGFAGSRAAERGVPLPADEKSAHPPAGLGAVPFDAALIQTAQVPQGNGVALASYDAEVVLQVTSTVPEAALQPAAAVGFVLPGRVLAGAPGSVTAHLAARALPGNGADHFAVALQTASGTTAWTRLDARAAFQDHVVVWRLASRGRADPPPRLLVAADLAGRGRGVELRRLDLTETTAVGADQAAITRGESEK